jgi:hypothetical protein
MFDFPATPTEGQIFAPSGGPVYVYKAPVWTVPGIGNVSMPTADTRNRLVNPSMQISQELGTTGSSVNGAYIADQWIVYSTGISFFASKSSVTTHQLQIGATTGKPTLAAGDFMVLIQYIEGIRMFDFGWGTAAAKPAVLAFDVFSEVAGTFNAAIQNPAGTRSLVLPFTIPTANQFQRVTLAIPGDIAGVWAVDNTLGMFLYFTFACGTTFQTAGTGWQGGYFLGATGMTNGAAVANKSFLVRDVGLYLDPLNTGKAPPFVMPDEAEELRACRRYYYKVGSNYMYAVPRMVNDTYRVAYIQYPAAPRTGPAVTATGDVDGAGSISLSLAVYGDGFVVAHNVSNASSVLRVFSWVINARM